MTLAIAFFCPSSITVVLLANVAPVVALRSLDIAGIRAVSGLVV
jgi:hypothetical protein